MANLFIYLYVIEIIFPDFFYMFSIWKQKRPWRNIYYDIEISITKSDDIEIPRPKNLDIDIWELKHHDIKKRRQISHGIMIPRHLFRGQKSWHREFKTKKSRHRVSAELWPLCPLIKICTGRINTSLQNWQNFELFVKLFLWIIISLNLCENLF